MLAGLAPPVAGGYIAQDTGVSDPGTSWSPDNQYYVTAYGATANALNYLWTGPNTPPNKSSRTA